MTKQMNLKHGVDKKQDTKECLLCDSVYVNFPKREIFSDKYFGPGSVLATHWKGTLEEDGSIPYLNFGGGFTSVYNLSKFIELYTWNEHFIFTVLFQILFSKNPHCDMFCASLLLIFVSIYFT